MLEFEIYIVPGNMEEKDVNLYSNLDFATYFKRLIFLNINSLTSVYRRVTGGFPFNTFLVYFTAGNNFNAVFKLILCDVWSLKNKLFIIKMLIISMNMIRLYG